MDVLEELALEREADRLIRLTRAYRGEYPAYSESDLRRKAKQRGEVRECDLSLLRLPAAGADTEGGATPPPTPALSTLDSLLSTRYGLPLYDPKRRSRVKPGYDILLLLISYACDLTPRQRRVIDLTMAGFSPKHISERMRPSASTCSRDLDAAISVIRVRREQLEKDYDLDRTAKVLHLQSTYLPGSGSPSPLRATPADLAYARKVKRAVVGAVKPILVPVLGRSRPTRLSLGKLALTLPDSRYVRSA